MKTTVKRTLTFLLAFVMLLSCMNFSAMAAEVSLSMSYELDKNAVDVSKSEQVVVTVKNASKTPVAAVTFYVYCDTSVFTIAEAVYDEDDNHISGDVMLKGGYSGGNMAVTDIKTAIANENYNGDPTKTDGYAFLWSKNKNASSATICDIYFDVAAGTVNTDYTIEVGASSTGYSTVEKDTVTATSALAEGKSNVVKVSGGKELSEVAATITSQPNASYTYAYGENAPTLTVAVTRPAHLTSDDQMTFIWYNAAGTKVGEGKSFQPSLAAYGAESYYCEISNEYNGKTYSVKTNTTTVTYTKKTVTKDMISVTNTAFTYDGGKKAPTVAVTGVDASEYTVTGTREATLPSDSYSLGVDFSASKNYTGGPFTGYTWKISKADITVNANPSITIYSNGVDTVIPASVVNPQTEGGQTAAISYKVKTALDGLTLTNGVLNATKTGTAVLTATVTAPYHNDKVVDVAVTVSAKKSVKDQLKGLEVTASEDQLVYTEGMSMKLSEIISALDTTGVKADGTSSVKYYMGAKEVTLDQAITAAGEYTVRAVYDDLTQNGDREVTFTIEKASIDVSDWTWNYSKAFTFDGNAKSVAVNSSDSKVTISYGASTVSATDAGTYNAAATATIAAEYAANYKIVGSIAPLRWTIDPQTIDVSGVTFTQADIPYDTVSHTVAVSGLPANVTVSYDGTRSATGVGAYTVKATLTAAKNYVLSGKSELSLTWNIVKAKGADLSVTLTPRYDDTAKKSYGASDLLALLPATEKTASILTAAADASASNAGNVDFSFASGTVAWNLKSGLAATDENETDTYILTWESSNYENGTLKLTIQIKDKIDVKEYIDFASGTAVYTGAVQTYEKATLKTNSFNLKQENIFYTYDKAEVKNVDTYTVTATYSDENYHGVATATFTITPASITLDTAKAANKPYDTKRTASVSDVTFKGLLGDTLGAEDYTVTAATFADAKVGIGKTVTYTVKLNDTAAARNYTLGANTTGATKANITALEITAALADVTNTQAFTGADVKPAVTPTFTGNLDAVDYVVTYKDNVYAGENTASVTVSPAENGNYTFTPVTKYFSIPKAEAPASIAGSTQMYKYTANNQGKGQITGIPDMAGQRTYDIVSVTDEAGILDGAPTVAAATVMYKLKGQTSWNDKMTATIKVRVNMQNYESKEVDIVVTLLDKETPVVTPNTIKVVYTGEQLTDSVITGASNTEGSWSWVTKPGTDAGTYTGVVKFTPKDEETYMDVDVNVTVIIEKATPAGRPIYERINEEGKTLADAKLSAEEISVPGTIEWVKDETTKVKKQTAYEWIFTPADTKNYNVLEGSIVLWKATPDYQIPTITVTSKPTAVKFADVAEGSWYADAVEFAVERGLFTGVSETKFAPNGTMTRAMLVTVLWRLDGEEEAAEKASFTDVQSGSWYGEAVAWASENGIVEGYSASKFGPNDPVTREQLAAVLWRYSKYADIDVSVGEDTNILSYNDAFDISDWAYAPLQWACGAGLIEGSNGNLYPDANATRAQVATILMRFVEANDL